MSNHADVSPIIKFAYSHKYKLESLDNEYKRYVLDSIGCVLDVQGYDNNVKSILSSVYPGFITENLQYADKYLKNLYDVKFRNSDCVISPRGYLGQDSVIVVGIAPGYSDYSYGEPNLLHGPSSKMLHSLLFPNFKVYYTNVYKRPLSGNKYDEGLVLSDHSEFESEISFFGNAYKYIFLGNYSAFDHLITSRGLSNHIRIYHPSYLCRCPQHIVDDVRTQILEFFEK